MTLNNVVVQIGEKEWIDYKEVARGNPTTIVNQPALQVVTWGLGGPIHRFEEMSILMGLHDWYASYRTDGWAPPAIFASTWTWRDGQQAAMDTVSRAQGTCSHGGLGESSLLSRKNLTQGLVENVKKSKRFAIRSNPTSNQTIPSSLNNTLGAIPQDPWFYNDVGDARRAAIYEFTHADTPVVDMQDTTMTCWCQTLQDVSSQYQAFKLPCPTRAY